MGLYCAAPTKGEFTVVYFTSQSSQGNVQDFHVRHRCIGDTKKTAPRQLWPEDVCWFHELFMSFLRQTTAEKKV